MLTVPGQKITLGEINVGSRSVFDTPDSPRSIIRRSVGS